MRRLSASAAKGHLVHIIDPAEEDFPFEGRTRFESVAGAETETFGRAESVQHSLSSPLSRPWRSVGALARRFGWNYLAHRTDRSAGLALIALYAAIGGENAQRMA